MELYDQSRSPRRGSILEAGRVNRVKSQKIHPIGARESFRWHQLVRLNEGGWVQAAFGGGV